MKSCILLLFALLAGAHLATAAPPVPADFGYGCALPTTSGAGVFRASLPLAVYEKTLRADLGDMRVFNAAGEMVPLRCGASRRIQGNQNLRALVSSARNAAAVDRRPFPAGHPIRSGRRGHG